MVLQNTQQGYDRDLWGWLWIYAYPTDFMDLWDYHTEFHDLYTD